MPQKVFFVYLIEIASIKSNFIQLHDRCGNHVGKKNNVLYKI